jgi:hypothetical protein
MDIILIAEESSPAGLLRELRDFKRKDTEERSDKERAAHHASRATFKVFFIWRVLSLCLFGRKTANTVWQRGAGRIFFARENSPPNFEKSVV